MMTGMKRVLKAWIPPALLQAYQGIRGDTIRFQGHYATWDSACAASVGYDSDVILQKARAAARMVKRGEAVYERDSVVFDRVEFSYPVLASLLRGACAGQGRLRVLDVGGGLGTTYREFKAFQVQLQSLTWTVVEQAMFVEVGQAEFADQELRFAPTISAAVVDGAPDVIVLSSVLQYVENPYRLIEEVSATACRSIVVARTPCANIEQDVLTVQQVPASIYEASYPCWIFSCDKLRDAFLAQHRLVTSFEEVSGQWAYDGGVFGLSGFLFDRERPSDVC